MPLVVSSICQNNCNTFKLTDVVSDWCEKAENLFHFTDWRYQSNDDKTIVVGYKFFSPEELGVRSLSPRVIALVVVANYGDLKIKNNTSEVAKPIEQVLLDLTEVLSA